jgi:serine/threonine-protein kinase
VTPQRHAQIRELFLAACERPSEQRPAFLEEACGEDQDLLKEVERLLAHHTTGASTDTGSLRLPNSETAGPPDDGPPPYQPGEMIAGRYRIVALIGKGGMGCVYRADDLTLGQTVALKFLPAERSADAAWLQRFHQEVRLARNVTHPNVCRVYDIGQADGVPFISMEYVDGEDLASLLRRIGRIPPDKGVEIARQLCAGLAAAHIRGVLHRDLKPANVMIDGRGQVRITDFGLAGLAGHVARGEIRAGTPRYMAPEQLAGMAVSERSDIYSLGLVLYELFTGKAAFTADGFAEYAKLHQNADSPTPSSLAPDIEPKVERIILACLRKDPAARPASALLVAAGLPGGDLLAAALAAGETPSPEMVAAAGEGRHVRHPAIIAAFVGFLALFLLDFVLGSRAHPVILSSLQKSPEVLAEKARDTVVHAGYPHRFTNDAYELTGALERGFLYERPPPQALHLDLDISQGNSLAFWYRHSSTPLQPTDAFNVLFSNARVTLDDPPPPRLGMQTVILDSRGRLRLLEAAPPVACAETPLPSPANWQSLFRDAGLDEASFAPTEPLLLPRFYATERRAWLGTLPDAPQTSLRVEAAADEGRVVFFAVLSPSDPDDASALTEANLRRWFMRLVRQASLFLVVIVAAPMAWRNTKVGRGDRRGALRVAAFIVVLRLIIWQLMASHVSSLYGEMELAAYALLGALAEGASVWLFYLALEPYVRKFWPQTLLGWSRILSGRFREPLVAGNIVVGGLVGTFWALMGALDRLIPTWLGWTTRSDVRLFQDLSYLLGPRQALGWSLDLLRNAIYQGVFFLLIIVLFQVLVRRTWLAILLSTLLIAPMYVPMGSHPLTAWILIGGGGVLLAVWTFVHFGLVTVVAALFVAGVLNLFPMATAAFRWYSDTAMFIRLLPIALVLFAFLEAIRRRPHPGAGSA